MAQPKAQLAHDYRITPLAGFVICKPLKEEQDEASGMYLPDTMSDKDGAGEVVAVGPSYTILEGTQTIQVESPVNIGDKIIFSNFVQPNYLDFKTGKHLYILKFHPDPRYNEILGIINK